MLTDKTIIEFIMPSRIIVNVFHSPYYKEVAKQIIDCGPEYLSPTYNKLELAESDRGCQRWKG